MYFTLQYSTYQSRIWEYFRRADRGFVSRGTERVSFTDTTEYPSITGHKSA